MLDDRDVFGRLPFSMQYCDLGMAFLASGICGVYVCMFVCMYVCT